MPRPHADAETPLPMLIFDGECGFCTAAARLTWQLVSRDRFEIRPWQQLGPEVLARWGLTEGDCAAAVQLVDRDGRVTSGHEAVLSALRLGHRAWGPTARLLGRPAWQPVLARGYELVADNRHRLPGSTPACRRA